jgi:ribosomal-protein-alanine N-acetyltransferase
MDFRRSIPADAKGIARLEAAVFPDAWDLRSVEDLISTEGAMCFTATDNGEVVAYVIGRLIAPEGEIYRVAVAESHRRRGVAYRLLDYAVKTSRGKGLESLFLEVRSRNTPAINLYRAYGFNEIARRKGYYKNPDDDAIIMLKANPIDLIN